MRTLFITHHYLHQAGGACLASSAYINALAELSDEFLLLYPYKKGAEPRFLAPSIHVVPVSYVKSKALKFLDLALGRVHRYGNVRQILGKRRFDLVVFDTSVVSYRLIDYFKSQGAKTVCIHHNYQYEYFRDNTHGIIGWLTLNWCKRYEEEAVRKCDLNLTLTDDDIRLLKEHCGKGGERFVRIGVFEHNRRPMTLQPKNVKDTKLHTFVISGSLSSVQTEQSLLPWLKDYYPVMRELNPNHRLIITGRNPSQRIIEACAQYPEIELIPNPDNILEQVQRADVYICPTSLGGGLKLRCMDGLRCGLPVITHSVSARGYEDFVKAGVMLPYTTPDDFRKALRIVCQQKSSAKDIADIYNATFSFDAGIKRMHNAIKGLTFDT